MKAPNGNYFHPRDAPSEGLRPDCAEICKFLGSGQLETIVPFCLRSGHGRRTRPKFSTCSLEYNVNEIQRDWCRTGFPHT